MRAGRTQVANVIRQPQAPPQQAICWRGRLISNTVRAGIAGLLLLVSSGASAQQLMNPGFDANLQPWVDPQYPDRILAWSSEDSSNSSQSGSLLHVGDDTSGGVGLALNQCVDVVPGGTYTAGGEAYVPGGQSGDIAPWIIIEEYNQDNCVSYTGRNWSLGPISVVGSWQAFSPVEVVVLATTESVKVHLGAWVAPGGVDEEVHFDDIIFGGGPVFGDGFESGDTTAWSTTTP
jgi:hypothetical protein